MTTTELSEHDHNCARRHAEGVLKRGSAYSNPAKNLARCYLGACRTIAEERTKLNTVERLDHAEEVAQLRDEVDRYRELAHELAFMVANLTSSKVPQ